MAEPSEPQRPRLDVRTVAVAAGVVLLIVSGTAGVFRGFRADKVDRGDAVMRAALGALAGLAVAAAVLAALAWHRNRRGLSASALGAGAVAALLALLIGGGATLGAATTPPTTINSQAEAAPTTDNDGPPSLDATVSANEAAIDRETGRTFIDTNGDGILDMELVPCPPLPTDTSAGQGPVSTVPQSTATIPPREEGARQLIAIDNECDGIVDEYVWAVVRDNVGLPTALPRPGVTTPLPPPDDDSDDDGTQSQLASGLLLVLLVVIGAGLVAAVAAFARGWSPFTKRPTLPPPLPEPEPAEVDQEAAADSFSASARLLLDDPDPRRAIIAAYAALLDGLDAAGAPRASYEAPEEHLQRALRTLGVPPDDLSAVTRLFLVAKFSNNPVTEADRQAARHALHGAERHLRAAALRTAPTSPPSSPFPPPGPLLPPS